MTTIKEQYAEEDERSAKIRKESRSESAIAVLPTTREWLRIDEEYLIKLQSWKHGEKEVIDRLIRKTKKSIKYYIKRIEELEGRII